MCGSCIKPKELHFPVNTSSAVTLSTVRVRERKFVRSGLWDIFEHAGNMGLNFMGCTGKGVHTGVPVGEPESKLCACFVFLTTPHLFIIGLEKRNLYSSLDFCGNKV